jgi:hypothetical protein
METNEIFKKIREKIIYIKNERLAPGAIVVSGDIMYKIQDGRYKTEDNYPYFPDFTQIGKKVFDKVFGLPISVIKTNEKNYIEVYSKGFR